ncbi:hypothetical protein LSAT2_001515 [Lamellibrachia satsuma]|nr:hypothetical protein LSAT2_001515 [Lamellibrachia satsuma]
MQVYVVFVVIAIICGGQQPDPTAAVYGAKTMGQCMINCMKSFQRCVHQCPIINISSSNQFILCRKRQKECAKRCAKRFGPTEEKDK